MDFIRFKEHKARYRFCPFAERAPSITMTVQGEYPDKYPQGAVIHYTAGRFKKGKEDALNTLSYAEGRALCFFCIASDGTIYQQFSLKHWGYHAGSSKYNGMGDGLSSKLVGIEVCNAGKVTKVGDGIYKSWFGEVYREDEVRKVDEVYYTKFTKEQEESLSKLILWLKWNNPEVFCLDYILGHNEISSHKIDPGGSLSMTMTQYRKHLQEFYEEMVPQEPEIIFSNEHIPGVDALQLLINELFNFQLTLDGVPGYKTSAAFKAVFGRYLIGDPREEA